MTTPAPTPAEIALAIHNARAVTRRAYQTLIRHALEAGDKGKAERFRETMEKLERKWREDG